MIYYVDFEQIFWQTFSHTVSTWTACFLPDHEQIVDVVSNQTFFFKWSCIYVTIDARLTSKILNILKICFRSKMLLKFGFTRTILFAMNRFSMPRQSPLSWKFQPTNIAVEFANNILMLRIFVVTKSITVAVRLFTQITFEPLLFPLIDVFLVVSSCSYSKESLQAKRAGPIFQALKVPVYTSIVQFVSIDLCSKCCSSCRQNLYHVWKTIRKLWCSKTSSEHFRQSRGMPA